MGTEVDVAVAVVVGEAVAELVGVRVGVVGVEVGVSVWSVASACLLPPPVRGTAARTKARATASPAVRTLGLIIHLLRPVRNRSFDSRLLGPASHIHRKGLFTGCGRIKMASLRVSHGRRPKCIYKWRFFVDAAKMRVSEGEF